MEPEEIYEIGTTSIVALNIAGTPSRRRPRSGGGPASSRRYSGNTSKYSIAGLTQVAAVEPGRRGIRVNCVCPTSVRTLMLETFEEGMREARVLTAMSTLESIIDPEHVAAAMQLLVADDCPMISGQSLMVDCGVSTGISRTMWEKLGADDA